MAEVTSSDRATPTSGGRGSGASSWPELLLPSSDEHSIEYLPTDDVSPEQLDSILSVPGVMNYVSPATTHISTRRDKAGSDDALVGAEWIPTTVKVQNARNKSLNLDRNGFALKRSPVGHLEIDFLDQNDVVGKYYPHCEALVAETLLSLEDSRDGDTGEKKRKDVKVWAFDHNVRSTSTSAPRVKNADGAAVQNPAGLVHADYTHVSAPRRLLGLAQPPKANDVLRDRLAGSPLLDPDTVKDAIDGKRRYVFLNVWRSIRRDGPVLRCPLACVDAMTHNAKDLRTFQIHYTDRVGENYFVCPSQSEQSSHGWYYYPQMVMDEALLLKQWDSEGGLKGWNADSSDDGGEPGRMVEERSSFTIHSAFLDPSCPDDAPPRESIEVRCVAIWENE